jgi:hypothetical protein
MIVLLATEEMLSTRPSDVRIVHDWGMIAIHIDPSVDMYNTGYHIAVDGPLESIKGWLLPYKNIWYGVDSPILQEFEVGHIK